MRHAQPGESCAAAASPPSSFVTIVLQHSKNHIQMVRDGILPKIFAVLRSPMKSIKHKHYASVILSEVCAPLDNHRQVLPHPRCCTRHPHCLRPACSCARQVCEEGGLNAMVALCSHFSDDVRAYATNPLPCPSRHQPPALPVLFFCNVLSGSQLLPSSASARTPRCAGEKPTKILF